MGESQENRPDLYLAIVCAAGTDLTEVKNQLRAQLSVVGYKCVEIKVSQTISRLLGLTPSTDEYDRIKELMEAGDIIRANSDGAKGVASAVVAQIRSIRQDDTEGTQSTAYLIDSFKNPAEVDLFNLVYGRNYYTLSVYLHEDSRVDNLQNLIAKSRREPPTEEHKDLAKSLISDDQKGSGNIAQNVRETFPKADVFFDAGRDLSTQIKRFVGLVFGEPFITPTREEYYMSLARISALRSADLSRQIGAVIVDVNDTVAATGCNEAPYPGGGFYYEGRTGKIGDNRDYVKQFDPNYIEIQKSLIEFLGLLGEAGYIEPGQESSAIADALLHGQHKELMSNARVRNLIEFGRVVHAEMHALCQAAAAGRAVKGGTLYSTTYPCHGCARHIIAAGIREVVYIEPYPKSLTAQLYADEIEAVVGEICAADISKFDRITFRPFHGIAPILYQRVFSGRPRKEAQGTIARWDPANAVPVGAVFGVERPRVELSVSSTVASIVERAQAALDGGLPGEHSDG